VKQMYPDQDPATHESKIVNFFRCTFMEHSEHPPHPKKMPITAPFPPFFNAPQFACYENISRTFLYNEMPLHTTRPFPYSSCKAPDGLGSRGLEHLRHHIFILVS
jgi:hypothetical protein